MRDGVQPDQLSMSSVGCNVASVNQKNGVQIEGMPDVLIRLSRCCTPVPPDELMGLMRKGRGVTVHRADCADAAALAVDSARVVDVEGSSDGANTMFVAA
ncbi:MAG: hypothetical protein ACKOGL_05730, partial [Acidimicrobiaceae bacterium]